MYPGTILQPCIYNGRGYIDHPVDPAHNLLDDVFQLLRFLKPPFPYFCLSIAFYEYFPGTVDHDLRHGFVIHQFLQDIQPAEAVKQASSQPYPLLQRKIDSLPHITDSSVNPLQQLLIVHVTAFCQFLHNPAAQPGTDSFPVSFIFLLDPNSFLLQHPALMFLFHLHSPYPLSMFRSSAL